MSGRQLAFARVNAFFIATANKCPLIINYESIIRYTDYDFATVHRPISAYIYAKSY